MFVIVDLLRKQAAAIVGNVLRRGSKVQKFSSKGSDPSVEDLL